MSESADPSEKWNAFIEQARIKSQKRQEARVAHDSQPPPDFSGLPEQLVIFIDILGFSEAINSAAQKQGEEREDALAKIYKDLRFVREEFMVATEAVFPSEQADQNRDFGINCIAVSDCVIISINPSCSVTELVMSRSDHFGFLLSGLALAQWRCAADGIFVRGGIRHGFFYEKDGVIISPAYVQAVHLEKEARYPVIAIKQDTIDFIQRHKQPGDEPLEFPLISELEEPEKPCLHFLDFVNPEVIGDPKSISVIKTKIKEKMDGAQGEVRRKYEWLLEYVKRVEQEWEIPS